MIISKKISNRMSIDDGLDFQNNSLQMEIRHYFKVIIIGDAAVGKTSISSAFLNDNNVNRSLCTINIDFKTKSITINGAIAEMQIWDTCGQEIYRTLTAQYYRNSNGCLVVFDLSKRSTFSEISQWIENVEQSCGKDLAIVLVGNKVDLISERAVSFEEASKFAEMNKCEYMEVSAKNGTNVDYLFENLGKRMIQMASTVQDQKKRKKKKKGGKILRAFEDHSGKHKSDCCKK